MGDTLLSAALEPCLIHKAVFVSLQTTSPAAMFEGRSEYSTVSDKESEYIRQEAASGEYTLSELVARWNRAAETIKKHAGEAANYRQDYIRTTKEDRKKMVKLRAKGVSPQEIAKQFGVSVTVVYRA